MTDNRLLRDVFGKRYGEVLLVHIEESGPMATVYCSFPLNDCPQELWDKLDAQANAAENGAVRRPPQRPAPLADEQYREGFRGRAGEKDIRRIEMLRQATVQMATVNPAPYSVNKVNRHTVFTFDAGREIYELIDPEGQRWVMQTWSQIFDPALDLADLAGLAGRLDLPVGWRYQPRVPTSPLRVDTTTCSAHVIQDELANSYSLQTG
jgi:hypothetical protein